MRRLPVSLALLSALLIWVLFPFNTLADTIENQPELRETIAISTQVPNSSPTVDLTPLSTRTPLPTFNTTISPTASSVPVSTRPVSTRVPPGFDEPLPGAPGSDEPVPPIITIGPLFPVTTSIPSSPQATVRPLIVAPCPGFNSYGLKGAHRFLPLPTQSSLSGSYDVQMTVTACFCPIASNSPRCAISCNEGSSDPLCVQSNQRIVESLLSVSRAALQTTTTSSYLVSATNFEMIAYNSKRFTAPWNSTSLQNGQYSFGAKFFDVSGGVVASSNLEQLTVANIANPTTSPPSSASPTATNTPTRTPPRTPTTQPGVSSTPTVTAPPPQATSTIPPGSNPTNTPVATPVVSPLPTLKSIPSFSNWPPADTACRMLDIEIHAPVTLTDTREICFNPETGVLFTKDCLSKNCRALIPPVDYGAILSAEHIIDGSNPASSLCEIRGGANRLMTFTWDGKEYTEEHCAFADVDDPMKQSFISSMPYYMAASYALHKQAGVTDQWQTPVSIAEDSGESCGDESNSACDAPNVCPNGQKVLSCYFVPPVGTPVFEQNDLGEQIEVEDRYWTCHKISTDPVSAGMEPQGTHIYQLNDRSYPSELNISGLRTQVYFTCGGERNLQEPYYGNRPSQECVDAINPVNQNRPMCEQCKQECLSACFDSETGSCTGEYLGYGDTCGACQYACQWTYAGCLAP